MSEFPGYPITGSSPWNPLLAARPALPESSYLGLTSVPGFPEREFLSERALYDPLQLAALQRAYSTSPYSAVGFGAEEAARSYPTELTHLRNFGLESRYSIPGGIPDRRSPLFRSPGSQLPLSVSPLTFEQIYHTRDPSLVSPLSYNHGSTSRSGYGLEVHDALRTEVAQTFEPFRSSPRIEQGQLPAVRSSSAGNLYPKSGLKVNEAPKVATGKDNNKAKDSAKIWKPFDTFSPEKQQAENNNNVADQDKNIPGFNYRYVKSGSENVSPAFMKYSDVDTKVKDACTPSPKSTSQFPLKPVPVFEKPQAEIGLEKNKLSHFQSGVNSNESKYKSLGASPLELLQQLSNSQAGPYTGTYSDGNTLPAHSPAFHHQDSKSSFSPPVDDTKIPLPRSQTDCTRSYREQFRDTTACLQNNPELNPPTNSFANLKSNYVNIQNVNAVSLDEGSDSSRDHQPNIPDIHVPNAHYETVDIKQEVIPADSVTKSDIRNASEELGTFTSAKSGVDRSKVKLEQSSVYGDGTHFEQDNSKYQVTIDSSNQPASVEGLFPGSQHFLDHAANPSNSVTLTKEVYCITKREADSSVIDESPSGQVHSVRDSLERSIGDTNVKQKVEPHNELSLARTNASAINDYYSYDQTPVTTSIGAVDLSAKKDLSLHCSDSAISIELRPSDCFKDTNKSGENTIVESVQTPETASKESVEKTPDRITDTNITLNDVHSNGLTGNVNMMKDADNSNLSTGSQYSESDSDSQLSNNKLKNMHTITQHPGVNEANRTYGNVNEIGRNVTDNQQVIPDGNRLPRGQLSDNHGLKRGDYNMCQNYNQNQPYSMNFPRAGTFNENSHVLPNNHPLSGNDKPNNLPEQKPCPTDGYGQYQRRDSKPPSTQSREHTNVSHTKGITESSEVSATPRVGESSAENVINAQLKTGSEDPVLPRFNSSPAEGFVPKTEPVFSQMEDSNDGNSNQHSSPANPFQVQEVEKEKDGEVDQPFQWDYLHNKQFIDNVYSDQLGCEFSGVVKNEEDIRDTDSPKTFLDLDTIPKKSSLNSGMQRGGDPTRQQGMMEHGSYSSSHYSNQTAFNQRQNDSQMGRNQWGQFACKSEVGAGGGQIKSEGQGQYSLQQKQNVTDGQNYHGNQYNQNYQSNYYQNQSGGQNMKNYQGNYSDHGGYEGNYYNQGMQQTNGSSNGHRYGNQAYPGQSYSSEYNSNKSPAQAEEVLDETGKKKGKKRGRKRKCDKEVLDESKPHPTTIVMASENVGALIDPNRPECPVDNSGCKQKVETIFNYTVTDDLSPIAEQYLQIEQRICQRLLPFKYGWPTNVVYNPLVYAFQTHKVFVRRYCTSPRPILFLGMNPGPYGMSQNGVPFGEVGVVRDWMKIKGNIYKPETEHPKKPVHGLGCTRCEVSGSRFWGLFQKICKVPDNFFKNCFVYNFCPQAYMSESGKNITPPQLASSELEQINEACDIGLVELVKLLNIHLIIGVGKFVQTRASKALHNAGVTTVKVECILHPSPINPHANKGWEQIVAKQLIEIGVMHYLNSDMDDVQKSIGEWEQIAAQNAKVKFDDEPQEC